MKRIYKVALVAVLVIIIASVIAGVTNISPQTKPADQTTVESTPEPTETPAMTASEFMELYGNALLDDLRKSGMVAYHTIEGNYLTINTSVDGAASDFMACAISGNYDSWDNLITSMNGACSSIYQLMQQCGVADGHVSLNILNDTNPDNMLASSFDGVVVYNVADDFE